MNAQRRKEIAAAILTLDEAKNQIEAVRDDEQAAFDNLPESLQQGEKGQSMEEAIGNLDDAISEMESAISTLEAVQ